MHVVQPVPCVIVPLRQHTVFIWPLVACPWMPTLDLLDSTLYGLYNTVMTRLLFPCFIALTLMVANCGVIQFSCVSILSGKPEALVAHGGNVILRFVQG